MRKGNLIDGLSQQGSQTARKNAGSSPDEHLNRWPGTKHLSAIYLRTIRRCGYTRNLLSSTTPVWNQALQFWGHYSCGFSWIYELHQRCWRVFQLVRFSSLVIGKVGNRRKLPFDNGFEHRWLTIRTISFFDSSKFTRPMVLLTDVLFLALLGGTARPISPPSELSSESTHTYTHTHTYIYTYIHTYIDQLHHHYRHHLVLSCLGCLVLGGWTVCRLMAAA